MSKQRKGKKKPRNQPRTARISKAPLICPPRQQVRLVYQDATDLRLGSLNSWNYFTMRANSVYDPDPLLATGGISGFAEWGTLYRQYRVVQVHITWEVTNVGSNPPMTLICLCGPTTLVASSRSQLVNCFENRFTSKAISISTPGGMDRARVMHRFDMVTVLGSNQYMSDISYAGFLGTSPLNPVTMLYLSFLAYCPSTSAITNNIVSNLRLEYVVELFDHQLLNG